MDFYKIAERSVTKGRGDKKEIVSIEIYPDFIVSRSKDLMIRGGKFYAIWDEENNIWLQNDEYAVARLVDKELYAYKDKLLANMKVEVPVTVLNMASYKNKTWREFKYYISSISDNYHELDEHLTFLNTETKKTDYVSKRLNYALEEGSYEAWDELVSTLYNPSEREKIEWAIGAIVSGDSKTIQKFCVFYGEAGTGKSTIINIIQKLFEGYYVTFEAKALGSNNNQFAAEMFRSNPLVAIQHDGDLSRIEDNTKLNSIVSHEVMVINEKMKTQYMMKMNPFLIMGTNRPVKITDARSGIIRRLIDITPSGRILPPKKYDALMNQIDFELGAIAYHCLQVYRDLGKNYYKNYTAKEMIMKTDVFYNFVEANLDIFEKQDGMSLKQAYAMYKDYCEDALVEFKLPRHKFREELKVYYEGFEEVTYIEGKQVRSWYTGFKHEKMEAPVLKKEQKSFPLVMDQTDSLLDDILADCPAQYAKEDGTPEIAWAKVKTTLKDLDTKKVHYVLSQKKDPKLICLDFDIKNKKGEKDMMLNLEAASKWPKTYSEFSQGGGGIHLYYIYDGDVDKLKSTCSDGVEIKVFRGNGPLRRRVSRCNNLPIAHLPVGTLPLREEKMIDIYELKDQQHLINSIKKSLRKEDNVGGTKCEIDLIKKHLDDAYAAGFYYDVSDMRHDILVFAMNSTNNKEYCVAKIREMKFESKQAIEEKEAKKREAERVKKEDSKKELDAIPITFFDIEIYPPGIDEDGEDNPGLFLVCWKEQGERKPVYSKINPEPVWIETFLQEHKKLMGYNNRDYDNHMLAARQRGYDNARLYDLSKRKIVDKAKDTNFPEAYGFSYGDVRDIITNKQSLKKHEIDLGISHIEMGIPWDKPAPKRLWNKIVEYCSNDVIATEKVFEAYYGEFVAREILADISGGEVNDTSNQLTTKFMFGNDKHPKLVYTDLSVEFPGYKYVAFGEDGKRHNMYRGDDLGFGGWVYSNPGIYTNVALLDIQSMHPHSAVALNYFGDYTPRFKDILDARIAIKHGDYETARKMFDGKLEKYLDDPSKADQLAGALKIAINSVYGLTSASFDNPFHDKRNVNNIVALRGALFMRTLQDEVADRGFIVSHIKTDSIKIPNATREIIDFCMDFAKKYGYSFEHEATYDRMCLIDNAQYIAAYKDISECEKMYGYVPSDNKKHFKKNDHPWTSTGKEFQRPYIFKTMFSGEPVVFDDYCETNSVKDAAIYLDYNEDLPNVELEEKELEKRIFNQTRTDEKPRKLNPEFSDLTDEELKDRIANGHNYQFIGRVGRFYPVKPGSGGGIQLAYRREKYSSVSGSKGYRWLEAEEVQFYHKEDCLDPEYHNNQVIEAIEAINQFGSYERFVDLSKPYDTDISANKAPWDDVKEVIVPCGDGKKTSCIECQELKGTTCARGYSLESD